jgi:hypothetical protein
MGKVTSIAGSSGAGKSSSFENMNWKKTFIIRANRKPLPFRNKLKEWDSKEKTGNFIYSTDYEYINKVIKVLPKYGFTSIIVDDSTHLLLDEVMRTARETGFDKFMRMAENYYNLFKTAEGLPDDVRVYVINHIDTDDNGNEIIKIVGGKFITEKIDIPSMLTIAIKAVNHKSEYKFETQGVGRDFYKSPRGMFEDKIIDNDLRIVDDAIKDYYYIEDDNIDASAGEMVEILLAEKAKREAEED